MDKKKLKLLIVRVVVTFIEGALAALLVTDGLNRAALAGAAAAGLSAVYNALRSQYPEIFTFGVVKAK